MLGDHVHIFFIPVFCPFLNWVVCLFTVDLYPFSFTRLTSSLPWPSVKEFNILCIESIFQIINPSLLIGYLGQLRLSLLLTTYGLLSVALFLLGWVKEYEHVCRWCQLS